MRYLIIDGLNLFIRNFVVVPTMDQDGNPVGGLVGFLRAAKRLVDETKCDCAIVCWDGEGGSRRRRGIFAEYKMGRKVRTNRTYDNETPSDQSDNLGEQVSHLRRILGNVGFLQVEVPDIEADDAVAYLCHMLDEHQKVIVSSDRDLLQLVGPRTIMYSPSKKVYWTTKDVITEMGVLPENYIFVKAMMGDASDNVPGIGGIGQKTALKLFPFLGERVTTLEEILEHARANGDSAAKYKSVLEARDRLAENIRIMQLSSPIIGAQSARQIRTQVTGPVPRFSTVDVRLDLTRMGIDSLDRDFFGVIAAYRARAETTQ